MEPDAESCYRAMRTRDARFDGRFFVGVTSTRIYCRPVCGVRAPRRENCRFFASAAAAEVAGYRPCLRCRPELAPGRAAIDVSERLAQAAAALLDDGEPRGIEALAARVGVSARHMRRIFVQAFGVSPIEYAQTQRLLLAKRLLTDTAMPVADVAFASGFASLRRFNALFRSRYRMAPTALRVRRMDRGVAAEDTLAFDIPYRPPYAFDAMLAFLRNRAIDGVERVDGRAYRRSVSVVHRGVSCDGWIEVTHRPRKSALRVRASASLAKAIPPVLARVRHTFDLGCDPQEIARALGPLTAGRAGMRVPGTFDGFEVACRAIVGQQISVPAARTVLSRVAARYGRPLPTPDAGRLARLFPTAATLAATPAENLASVGVPVARARSIVAIAHEIAEGRLDLSPGADVDSSVSALLALPGIGPWTAQYVAMRALGWPDAFPHPDLGVMRALGETRPARALARAEAWRPWRAYAVIHIWSGTT